MSNIGVSPLRIRKEIAATGTAPAEKGDQYLGRLVKLIPSEVLAVYLTFKEAAASWLGIFAIICLGLVLLVRLVYTKDAEKLPQFGAVIVAAVSFIIWVYATGGYFLHLKLPEAYPGIISVVVALWTFMVPYFYRGD
jgi:glucan phosphoethanolaminetransferase (alkaline phosphatase superfamily)